MLIGKPGETSDKDELRRRSVTFFYRLARAACVAVKDGRHAQATLNAPMRNERPAVSSLVADLAHELYFAAGPQTTGDPAADAVATEKRLRLLDETKDTLLELGMSGIVEASDHVLDTLERYVGAAEPSRILSMFLSVARSAVDNGYQFSYSGFGVIDRTIRWYLVSQPELLRNEDNLSTLSAILDCFLDAGWPEAFLLARDLRELR